MLKYRLLVVATIAVLSIFWMSQTQLVAGDILQDIRDQYLPTPLRGRNITVEEVTRVFREKCKKVTGVYNSSLFQDVEKGALQLVGCFSTITNITALKEEIEIARPIGELDTVFHKHCKKAPVAEQCFRDFNKVLQPCLSKAEKNQNAVMVRIVTGLMGFMCARGGDQLAVFVAEDGPECLEANQNEISMCANKSFSEFKPRRQVSDLFNLPDFTVDPEHCVDLAKFEACSLHYLERCREITPVNVAGSVFKFVKNETGCTDFLEGKTKARSVLKDPNERSAGVHVKGGFGLSLLAAVFAAFCAKYFL